MSERSRWWWSLMTIGVLAAAGIVESARSGNVGLVGLMIGVELVTIGLAVSLRRRPPVALRADLASWLESTSAITGEATSRLADRAVSAYRAGLTDDREA